MLLKFTRICFIFIDFKPDHDFYCLFKNLLYSFFVVSNNDIVKIFLRLVGDSETLN